jgi:hypothetical protein
MSLIPLKELVLRVYRPSAPLTIFCEKCHLIMLPICVRGEELKVGNSH